MTWEMTVSYKTLLTQFMTSKIFSDFASSRYFYYMVENREHYGHSSQIYPIILKCNVKRFANKDIGKQSRQEDKVKYNIKFGKSRPEYSHRDTQS